MAIPMANAGVTVLGIINGVLIDLSIIDVLSILSFFCLVN